MRIRSHLLLLQVASLGVISLGASAGWLLNQRLEGEARREHQALEVKISQVAHVGFDLLQALPHLASYGDLGRDALVAQIRRDKERLGAFRHHLDEHLSSLLVDGVDPQLRSELQNIRIESIALESHLSQGLNQLQSSPGPAGQTEALRQLMRNQAMQDMRHHGEALALLYDRSEARASRLATARQRAIQNGIVSSALMLVLGWIVGVAVAMCSASTIQRPLRELESLMENPPDDLDARLRQPLFQRAPQEIANLSASFLALQQRVRSLLERLEQQARTDSLTQVGNRRLFEESLEREWARSIRSGEALSLLMLDVDHFKAFNDRYGHPEGDDCLRRIATAIRGQARRSTDLVCRIGGEEFAVLLPATPTDQAEDLASRILASVAALAIPHTAGGETGWVSMSIGLATSSAQPHQGAQQLVKRADTALYRRKRELGRNGLCIAAESD